MDRKLKQVITLQSAMAVEDIIETMRNGEKREAWLSIEERRMETVAREAVRLYKEKIGRRAVSMLVGKQKPSRN